MLNISFSEIKSALDNFSLPDVDLVIGIAEGGVAPAVLAANKLGCELKTIKINFRDENNSPRTEHPELIKTFEDQINGKRILIVDDVSVSGKTLDKASSLLAGNKIQTFVLKGKADYVLFPNIKDCVNWPWKSK